MCGLKGQHFRGSVESHHSVTQNGSLNFLVHRGHVPTEPFHMCTPSPLCLPSSASLCRGRENQSCHSYHPVQKQLAQKQNLPTSCAEVQRVQSPCIFMYTCKQQLHRTSECRSQDTLLSTAKSDRGNTLIPYIRRTKEEKEMKIKLISGNNYHHQLTTLCWNLACGTIVLAMECRQLYFSKQVNFLYSYIPDYFQLNTVSTDTVSEECYKPNQVRL